MKIEKIKKLNSGKYKIEFENKDKITTYDDVILKNNLLYKKELDNTELNQLYIDNKYYDVYNRTVNYITKRLRSEKEIYLFLEKFELDWTDNEKIIKELKKINLINDSKFTEAYVSDRLNLSSDGPDKIRKSLINYGIDDNLIENELGRIDSELINEKINKIVKKKMVHNHKYSLYVMKQKLMLELVNLGYNRSDINPILEAYQDTNNNIEKEYQKIYSKLSTKYSNQELYYRVKQKLYQKGYSSYEVDEVMKKE
ncbi:MAG: RecX family transcriptional regulator [Bacilli bacterium]|nr:RecX family transcriptional regulator [Bacilli bacterium]MDD4808830.1 RecX family transcriptional regulator [Bacilli bacterium]